MADTNVLLRSLDDDKTPASRAARERVKRARLGSPIAVLAATVLEVAYVLESSAAGYGWPRDAIASAVEAIVNEPGFEVEHAEALRAAASNYRDHAFDLHDCYLDAIARQRDARVLSFDADLARLGSGEKP